MEWQNGRMAEWICILPFNHAGGRWCVAERQTLSTRTLTTLTSSWRIGKCDFTEKQQKEEGASALPYLCRKAVRCTSRAGTTYTGRYTGMARKYAFPRNDSTWAEHSWWGWRIWGGAAEAVRER